MFFLNFLFRKKKKEEVEVWPVEYLGGNEEEHDKILKEEHLRKIKSVKNSNNFGVLTYSYNKESNLDGYHPRKLNIGDYIQSTAAKQFLPQIDKYIDRDNISNYKGEKINLIMNAWWYIHNRNKTFSESINPLFVSFHLNNKEEIPSETLDYLKKHEPIGCRDKATRNFLLSKGIAAYFSGCLTLTLGQTYQNKTEEREKIIYLVDLEKNIKFKREIKELFKAYPKCKIQKIKHLFPFDKKTNITDKFKLADELLSKYAKAQLVITSRIHCALPCLAMGTPVVLAVNKYDKKRFMGLSKLFNFIGKNEFDQTVIDVLKDQNGLVKNNNEYKKYAGFLIEICSEFTKK